MITWTPAAEQELDRYCRGARATLTASGADPSEVRDDLRRHLELEARTGGLNVVTEADVRRWLARLDVPPPESDPRPATAAVPGLAVAPRKPGIWLVLVGVLLPGITLVAELATRMCAGAFFDPLPTIWHVLLVGWVPLANGLVWRALREEPARARPWLNWANGSAFGVALFYTVLFAPMALPGLLAIIVYGFGLLPLTPVLALVATVFLRGHLQRGRVGVEGIPGRSFWQGAVGAWLVLGVLDAPGWITRAALGMAVSDEPAVQQRGLSWLRLVGRENTLLRECYGRTLGAENMDLVGWLTGTRRQVSADQAREVYYRVTGRPFNAVPAPKVRTPRGVFADLEDWTWDTDQGGERVGGRVQGLTLQGSRLDAVVEPDAAVAYYEWTLEFKNVSNRQREARAQLQLPHGGVVSRLTLWVNGEEREAAFAGRAQTRRAYEQVAIRQRRDPVLVTTAGPDRILMQCFPVPADGGTMRVRLGITAPIPLESAGEGVVEWPAFLERNFTLPETLQHSLWIEGRGCLAALGEALRSEEPKPGTTAARGLVRDVDLGSSATLVRVERSAEVRQVWTRHSRSPAGGQIEGRLAEVEEPAPVLAVLVVDGAGTMAGYLAEVARVLEAWPQNIELAVIMAGDEPVTLAGPGRLDGAQLTALRERLTRWRTVGGQDNVPALVLAWDFAARQTNSVVLWIHAPQPVMLSTADALRQAFERRKSGPRVLALPVAPGPNRIIEQLEGLPALSAVPRRGTVAEDLRGLLTCWTGQRRGWAFEFVHVDPLPGAVPAGREVSLHAGRLWAAAEVRRLQATRAVAAAVELAASYQIVTPLSGAVVLETQEQYDQHGLEPADPLSVPAIPEPGIRALLLLGLLALGLRRRRK